MKILLVEDDEYLAQLLNQYLSDRNYIVDVAVDGESGLNYARTFDYDLLVLDVVLPKLDGISLCKTLRSEHYQMPVLLLTALDNSRDKVLGLDAGADDYVVKPVGLEELLARIRALVRRGRYSRPPIMTWGLLQLDPATCEVSYDGRPLCLTPKEYALLELFLRSPTQVFSREVIIEHLWSLEEPPTENTLRAHIKGLRTKLKAVDAPPKLIETIYGVGYRLQDYDDDLPKSDADPVPNRNATTLNAIQALWQRIKPNVLKRVDRLEEGISALAAHDETLQGTARQEAHKLAGSLGTFGYHYGSSLARKIEEMLLQERAFTQPQLDQLQQWLVELRQQFQGHPTAVVPEPPTLPDPEQRRLLIVDDDRLLAEQIAEEAETWGMDVKIATTIQEARPAIVTYSPGLILLDLNFPEPGEDGLMLLEELARNRPEIPVVVLTVRDSFQDRLSVSRLGSQAFLQKPIPMPQILEVAMEVIQRSHTAAKVMIVDDDQQELQGLSTLLSPWGLQLHSLDDPRDFWQALETFMPDLLVLDFEMPHYSGIELCQVVRNEPQWRKLPILFLTAHTDSATVDRIFQAGADDYVSKPISGPELISRLFNRLERTKLLQNLAELDSLTGLANRRKSSYDIANLLRLALRNDRRCSFAMLDLDHFKPVNDTYGHATGDLVLHRFGEMLRDAFRSDDVVGRWGGEEFVVVMADTSAASAAQRLSTILEQWRSQAFILEDEVHLTITFSAGVAEFPQDGDDLPALYRHADQALYQAKEAGRGRIVLYSPKSEEELGR
ncbi:transcriptional regulator [Phormidium willei BDU 130791]|nr:transcriptional regulator [Phormidium willei BDU 130791]